MAKRFMKLKYAWRFGILIAFLECSSSPSPSSSPPPPSSALPPRRSTSPRAMSCGVSPVSGTAMGRGSLCIEVTGQAGRDEWIGGVVGGGEGQAKQHPSSSSSKYSCSSGQAVQHPTAAAAVTTATATTATATATATAATISPPNDRKHHALNQRRNQGLVLRPAERGASAAIIALTPSLPTSGAARSFVSFRSRDTIVPAHSHPAPRPSSSCSEDGLAPPPPAALFQRESLAGMSVSKLPKVLVRPPGGTPVAAIRLSDFAEAQKSQATEPGQPHLPFGEGGTYIPPLLDAQSGWADKEGEGFRKRPKRRMCMLCKGLQRLRASYGVPNSRGEWVLVICSSCKPLAEKTDLGFLVRGMAENKTIPGGGAARAENAKTSVILLHKRCAVCIKWASWGVDPAQSGKGGKVGAKLRCSQHREAGHINLARTMCRYGVCGRQASYGDAGSGSANRCVAHREQGQVYKKKIVYKKKRRKNRAAVLEEEEEERWRAAPAHWRQR